MQRYPLSTLPLNRAVADNIPKNNISPTMAAKQDMDDYYSSPKLSLSEISVTENYNSGSNFFATRYGLSKSDDNFISYDLQPYQTNIQTVTNESIKKKNNNNNNNISGFHVSYSEDDTIPEGDAVDNELMDIERNLEDQLVRARHDASQWRKVQSDLDLLAFEVQRLQQLLSFSESEKIIAESTISSLKEQLNIVSSESSIICNDFERHKLEMSSKENEYICQINEQSVQLIKLRNCLDEKEAQLLSIHKSKSGLESAVSIELTNSRNAVFEAVNQKKLAEQNLQGVKLQLKEVSILNENLKEKICIISKELSTISTENQSLSASCIAIEQKFSKSEIKFKNLMEFASADRLLLAKEIFVAQAEKRELQLKSDQAVSSLKSVDEKDKLIKRLISERKNFEDLSEKHHLEYVSLEKRFNKHIDDFQQQLESKQHECSEAISGLTAAEAKWSSDVKALKSVIESLQSQIRQSSNVGNELSVICNEWKLKAEANENRAVNAEKQINLISIEKDEISSILINRSTFLASVQNQNNGLIGELKMSRLEVLNIKKTVSIMSADHSLLCLEVESMRAKLVEQKESSDSSSYARKQLLSLLQISQNELRELETSSSAMRLFLESDIALFLSEHRISSSERDYFKEQVGIYKKRIYEIEAHTVRGRTAGLNELSIKRDSSDLEILRRRCDSAEASIVLIREQYERKISDLEQALLEVSQFNSLEDCRIDKHKETNALETGSNSSWVTKIISISGVTSSLSMDIKRGLWLDICNQFGLVDAILSDPNGRLRSLLQNPGNNRDQIVLSSERESSFWDRALRKVASFSSHSGITSLTSISFIDKDIYASSVLSVFPDVLTLFVTALAEKCVLLKLLQLTIAENDIALRDAANGGTPYITSPSPIKRSRDRVVNSVGDHDRVREAQLEHISAVEEELHMMRLENSILHKKLEKSNAAEELNENDASARLLIERELKIARGEIDRLHIELDSHTSKTNSHRLMSIEFDELLSSRLVLERQFEACKISLRECVMAAEADRKMFVAIMEDLENFCIASMSNMTNLEKSYESTIKQQHDKMSLLEKEIRQFEIDNSMREIGALTPLKPSISHRSCCDNLQKENEVLKYDLNKSIDRANILKSTCESLEKDLEKIKSSTGSTKENSPGNGSRIRLLKTELRRLSDELSFYKNRHDSLDQLAKDIALRDADTQKYKDDLTNKRGEIKALKEENESQRYINDQLTLDITQHRIAIDDLRVVCNAAKAELESYRENSRASRASAVNDVEKYFLAKLLEKEKLLKQIEDECKAKDVSINELRNRSDQHSIDFNQDYSVDIQRQLENLKVDIQEERRRRHDMEVTLADQKTENNSLSHQLIQAISNLDICKGQLLEAENELSHMNSFFQSNDVEFDKKLQAGILSVQKRYEDVSTKLCDNALLAERKLQDLEHEFSLEKNDLMSLISSLREERDECLQHARSLADDVSDLQSQLVKAEVDLREALTFMQNNYSKENTSDAQLAEALSVLHKEKSDLEAALMTERHLLDKTRSDQDMLVQLIQRFEVDLRNVNSEKSQIQDELQKALATNSNNSQFVLTEMATALKHLSATVKKYRGKCAQYEADYATTLDDDVESIRRELGNDYSRCALFVASILSKSVLTLREELARSMAMIAGMLHVASSNYLSDNGACILDLNTAAEQLDTLADHLATFVKLVHRFEYFCGGMSEANPNESAQIRINKLSSSKVMRDAIERVGENQGPHRKAKK